MDSRRPRLLGLALLTFTMGPLPQIACITPAHANEVADWNGMAVEILPWPASTQYLQPYRP